MPRDQISSKMTLPLIGDVSEIHSHSGVALGARWCLSRAEPCSCLWGKDGVECGRHVSKCLYLMCHCWCYGWPCPGLIPEEIASKFQNSSQVVPYTLPVPSYHPFHESHAFTSIIIIFHPLNGPSKAFRYASLQICCFGCSGNSSVFFLAWRRVEECASREVIGPVRDRSPLAGRLERLYPRLRRHVAERARWCVACEFCQLSAW
jgi:hypothetical protein